MNHPIVDTEALAASQLTGAEALFLDVLEAVIRGHVGAACRSDAASELAHPGSAADGLLQLLLPFLTEFRLRYAALLDRQLGVAGAEAALAAFGSAPLKRYVAARRAMVPELTVGLSRLLRQMGDIEL